MTAPETSSNDNSHLATERRPATAAAAAATAHVQSNTTASTAPASEALNAMQHSMATFGAMAPPPALPITVTDVGPAAPQKSSVQASNRHNHEAGGTGPSKQLYPAGSPTTKRTSGVLTQPSALAGPGGGITLGSVAVVAKKGKNLSESVSDFVLGGYSAACRATIQGMRSASDDARLSGAKRVSSAPALSSAPSSTTYKYRKVVGGKIPRSMSMTLPTELSPQLVLDKMIQARGYSTQNFCSLEGAYYCKPTPLQIASYGIRMVQAIRDSDTETVRQMLDCGLSPNPCNAFGESVVHMVCRRGDTALLKLLVDRGCSLQVTDDFGRTPLHDACWTAEPNFEIVSMILDADERLLHVVDCRGSSPLSYIKKEHWKQWIDFFRSKAGIYWAPRDLAKDGEEPPPRLATEPPHSRPIPDPFNAAPLEEATLISSGKLDTNDALQHKTAIKTERQPLVVEQVAAPAAC